MSKFYHFEFIYFSRNEISVKLFGFALELCYSLKTKNTFLFNQGAEPEFCKPVLRYSCQILTELYFSKSQRANRN